MNNSGTTDKGKVITFYSFKGGVGRSMALVNVATLLSSWGKKVLMVDWDLEAPGLEKFFNGATEGLDTSKQEGLLELLQALQTQETVDWQQYVFSFSTKLSKTPLDLIIAGRNHDQYTEELRTFNVADFYEAQKGAYRLENLRNEWLETYDYVLIDSRTGVTDFGGICTIHMPDILVMLLTPTEQGLRGTLRIAERADKARQSLPFDREKLLVFPLPSRIDGTTEFEKSRQWIKRFAESFEPIFDNWLPADIAPEDFLQRVKIPYIPYFSYGETLPVIEQGMNDPAGLGYAYENIAMLLAQGLDRVDVFWGERDSYLFDIKYQKDPKRIAELLIILKKVRNSWEKSQKSGVASSMSDSFLEFYDFLQDYQKSYERIPFDVLKKNPITRSIEKMLDSMQSLQKTVESIRSKTAEIAKHNPNSDKK